MKIGQNRGLAFCWPGPCRQKTPLATRPSAFFSVARESTIDPSKYRFNFVGLGKFGYALLISLAQSGFNIRGFTRTASDADAFNQNGSHPSRFPHIRLSGKNFMPIPNISKTTLTVPGEVGFSTDLSLLGNNGKNGPREIVLFNVPSKFAAASIDELAKIGIPKGTILVTGSKGIAMGADQKPKLVSTLLRAAFPENPIIYLAGPSFAEGIVSGEPTFLTAVSQSPRHARIAGAIASLVGHRREVLFCNVHDDAIAVQLAGVLKNAFAIASGACHGIGYDIGNGLHAVLSLGFREMIEFGIRAGAKPLSFQHNAAMGDFYMSASSEKSRNFRLGKLYGKTWIHQRRAPTTEEIHSTLGQEVAEGANTLRLLKPILDEIEQREGNRNGFPVLRATHALLFENANPQRLITDIQKFQGFPHEIREFPQPYLEF